MANEGQREYWNTTAGERWVAHQQAFDRAFGEQNRILFGRAGIQPGMRVLDVGCGSGTIALEAARRSGAAGDVLGVDVSEPLLALARERARASGRRNLRFLMADAQTHELQQGAVDLIVSRLGVMFFDAPVAAFRNLRGALKSGGRLCFVCWAGLSANPWFDMPLAVGVRRLGPPAPQRPHAPGPLAFSDPDYVKHVLDEAGFCRIAVEKAHPSIPGHSTVKAEAAFALSAGLLTRLLNEKNPAPAIRQEIVEEVAEGFRPFMTENGLRTPSTIYCVTADGTGEA